MADIIGQTRQLPCDFDSQHPPEASQGCYRDYTGDSLRQSPLTQRRALPPPPTLLHRSPTTTTATQSSVNHGLHVGKLTTERHLPVAVSPSNPWSRFSIQKIFPSNIPAKSLIIRPTLITDGKV